jgi:hypothetical protein
MVVVTAGLRDADSVINPLLDSFISPALHPGSLPEQPEIAAELVARIAGLGRPQPRSVPALPTLAAQISGQRWKLDPNGLGLTAFRLDFTGPTALLTLEAGDDQAVVPLGLDGVQRVAVVEHLGNMADHDLMAAVGGWREGRTLIMRWYSVNNPEYWGVEIAFGSQQAVLRWEDMLSGHRETVDARRA